MNDKIKLAKGVTKFVVSTSVGSVVAKAIRSHVATTTSIEQIQLVVGSYAVAGMVSDKAVDWSSDKFDEALEFVRKIATSVEKEDTTA